MVILPCIVGPTGAGKTAAALALAAELPCSVINADSRQVYRDFPRITAQPAPDEASQCPHLLYGYLDIEEKLSAGTYARTAASTIEDVVQTKRTPLLVGGTGLYFRALLEGIAPIPHVPPSLASAWQERCNTEGSLALHALLQDIDPSYAAKVHPHDRQRITRALEVWQATGKTFSWWHNQPLPPSSYSVQKVGITLPLAELEKILQNRIDAMLEQGAVAEAQAALTRCDDPTAPGWSGIGCRELYLYCKKEISLEACKTLWLRNTRAYAKRQLTWFMADSHIHWFAPRQKEEAVEMLLRWIQKTKENTDESIHTLK